MLACIPFIEEKTDFKGLRKNTLAPETDCCFIYHPESQNFETSLTWAFKTKKLEEKREKMAKKIDEKENSRSCIVQERLLSVL